MEALVEYVVTQRQRPHIRDEWRTGIARVTHPATGTGTDAAVAPSAADGTRTPGTATSSAARVPPQPTPIPQSHPPESRQAPLIPAPAENSENGRIAIEHMNNLSLSSPRHQPVPVSSASSVPRPTASTEAASVQTAGTVNSIGTAEPQSQPQPNLHLSDVFGTLIATIEECWDAESEARLSASCVEDRLARLERALLAAMPLPELPPAQYNSSSDSVSFYEL